MKKELVFKYYQDYKLYTFPLVITLSSLILIVFVIYPQLTKLIGNHKEEGSIETKSKFLEAKVQALESYDQEDLKNKVNVVLDTYPTDKDYITVLGLLNNLSAQSGFSVASMSVGSNAAKNTNSQSYTIKLDIMGPANSIPILLSKIESSSRLMKINNVEVVLGRDNKPSTITLSVDVLYSSAPKEFGSIDSTAPELSQKEEEIIVRLAQVASTSRSKSSQVETAQPGPRGKANPFE